MEQDEALDFIREQRAAGYSDDDLRQSFRDSGWADADIDALLAPPPRTAPAPASSTNLRWIPYAIVGILLIGVALALQDPLATYLAHRDERDPGAPRSSMAPPSRGDTTAACQAKLQRIATAMTSYVRDHKGHLPPSDKPGPSLLSYIGEENFWQCPAGGFYAMNPRLGNLALASVTDPAHTVLIFECGRNGNVEYRHDGQAWIMFADYHLQLCNMPTTRRAKW